MENLKPVRMKRRVAGIITTSSYFLADVEPRRYRLTYMWPMFDLCLTSVWHQPTYHVKRDRFLDTPSLLELPPPWPRLIIARVDDVKLSVELYSYTVTSLQKLTAFSFLRYLSVDGKPVIWIVNFTYVDSRTKPPRTNIMYVM